MAKELLGNATDELIGEAAEAGFISRDEQREPAVHPLLESFLLAKLHELPAEEVHEMVRRVVAAAATHGQWDACLEALQRFPQPELIGSTLRGALTELLSAGRVATVKRWVELAAANDHFELTQPQVPSVEPSSTLPRFR